MFGRFIGSYGAVLLTTFSIGLAAIISCLVFYEIALCGSPCHIKTVLWISTEFFYNDWGFLFDSLTVIMLVVVTIISTLVHMYSSEYMSHDPYLPRFMSYLSLFTAFMLVLVTADNYIQMFLGWEGIGLTSYLLINFWFTRLQANKAAIKAMILNRIGDFGLAIAIFLIYAYFKSLDYDTVFAIVYLFKEKIVYFFFFESNLLDLIGILLFVGAIGKSAQLGLHTWLPDAMEGPTPVSALIHAATLVTAGVFLLARSSPILELSNGALATITIFGALTAFFAATAGLLQNDLKRVIAYSTCSQLGYMVFACGLSNYSAGIFHLANHAFFKALLFLSAGSVIHGVQDEQDMRKMGGLLKLIPFTYSMIFIGSFSLMGLPFLTGYYSKDFILEVAYAKYTTKAHFSYWLGCFAAFFTAFYSVRLIFLTFLSEPNGFRPIIVKAHDSSAKMALPLAILAIPSIFIGFFTQDMIIGMGTDFWGNAIYVQPTNLSNIDVECIPFSVKILPVLLSFLGACSAFFVFSYGQQLLYETKLSGVGRKFYTFLNKKWFFDKVYNELIAQNLLFFSYSVSYKIIDKGVIEFFGPRGLTFFVSTKANVLKKFQTGYIYQYAFFIFIGAAVMILAVTISSYTVVLLDYTFLFILLVGFLALNY
jgi:NADH-ubiquinone oxidoreductase chain 5